MNRLFLLPLCLLVPAGCGSPPPENASPANAETASDAQPETQRVAAEVGVGSKGRNLEGSDPITVPIKAGFRAKERIVFEIQIPQAMKLFKAMHGRHPESHDEFMQEIIRPNRIKLPELPPGERYVYNPEKAELEVERTR